MASVMNRFSSAVVAGLSLVLALSAVATAAPKGGAPLDIRAEDLEYDTKTGIATANGSAEKQVRIEYKGMVLEADRMQVHRTTKDVVAKGNVVFADGTRIWKGEEISGNLDSKTFSSGVFDLKFGPWYGHAKSATRNSAGRVTVAHPRVTTCDHENPHYSISAKRIVYYPNGKFRAYHAVYRVGRVPVFYWPFVLGDTSDKGGNLSIKPGYSSDWGPYLLLAKDYRIGDFGKSTFMLDLRTKNGVAVGNRTRLKLARSETDFLAYGMYDADTPETTDGYNRRFESEDWRYRVSLYERVDLTPDLVFRGQANLLSDIDMLEDWFEREYDRNPQPYSYADLTWNGEHVSLSLSARPRLNDFYTAVEQLPELHFLLPRQQVFGLPLYLQSELTFGHYEMSWREFDEPFPGEDDPLNAEGYKSWRANWINMLYAPFSLGELHIVPRAGFQAVGYSDSSETGLTDPMLRTLFGHDNVNLAGYPIAGPLPRYDDNDDDNGATNFAGELGVEMSTKLYRTWQDSKNDMLAIDGLRHVVQPYINYTYVSDPSEDRENLYFFDQNDRLAEMNFVRVGVNQRMQTRRHGRIYTFVSMQTYADFHFDKQKYYSADADPVADVEPDAERGAAGNLGNRIDFRPREGVDFWNTVVFDMDEGELNRAEVGMSLGRDERKRLSLSYVFRNDYVPRALYSMGSSLLDFTGENNLYATAYEEAHWLRAELSLPINAKTTGRVLLSYDIEDNEVSHASLQILRDLHCWMGALAVGEDNGDFFVSLMLYLKAFPSMRVDGDI